MALISCAVTAQLICAFVFVYANCFFFYAVAHFIITGTVQPHYNVPHYNAVFSITQPCHGSQSNYFAMSIASSHVITWFHLFYNTVCLWTPNDSIIMRLTCNIISPTFYSYNIRITCPCNNFPLKPLFYKVKMGFAGACLFLLFLIQNIDCGYSFGTSANNQCFEQLD